MSKQYFKVIPAVYLLLRRDDEILLLKRANTGYEDDKYSLPAGHLEGDESLRSAIVREIYEEIGLKIKPKALTLAHVQHRRSRTPDLSDERIVFYFTCTEWQGRPANKEPNKCSEIQWLDISIAKNRGDVIDHVRVAIESIADGNFESTFGWR